MAATSFFVNGKSGETDEDMEFYHSCNLHIDFMLVAVIVYNLLDQNAIQIKLNSQYIYHSQLNSGQQ